MSGFEVVGVVLGALPLVIEGLKAYGSGVEKIKDAWYYDIVVQDLLVSLNTGFAIYRSSCEELLTSLMLPDDDLYELLSNPYGDKWKDEAVSARIRERLGENFDSYTKAVRRLKERIELFKKKLYLDDDYKPSWITNNEPGLLDKIFNKPLRAIKIGLHSGNFEKLMGKIDFDINQISTLTSKNIELGPQRLDRQRRKNSQVWSNIRTHARRIYEALAHQWTTKCSCQHHHRADLRLDISEPQGDCNEGIHFRCLFSIEANNQATFAVPWNWRDVEIELLQMGNDSGLSSSSGSKIQPTVLGQKKAVLSKKVAWAGLQTQSTSSKSNVPASRLSVAQCVAKIENLCKSLEQPQSKICCLGYLEDKQMGRHQLYAASPWQQALEQRHATTLKATLESGSLPTIQKYKFALALAFSLLQLHTTPWLGHSLDLSDVRLIANSNSSTAIDAMYISRGFSSKTSTSNKPSSRSFIKNEQVFALGVALLELSYGQPLLSLKTDADPDPSIGTAVFTEYSIACRLVDDVALREGDRYASAAKRCVLLRFETTNSTSLDDATFQQLFYQGVIEPLREIYTFATKGL
ncbi:hypothetical protein N431DRAFT_481106 [Stipitochalara longipes BDJ]|nr:hypothetical protein N431DRAFT_481106 [Stipitochalara longipes BDJ]